MKAREKKPLISRQHDAVEIKKNRTIQAYFILIVFLTLLFAGIIIAAVFVLFSSLNFFDLTNGILIPIAVAIACIVVGTGLAAIASKHFMRRISLVRKGMSEVAKGNFKVRVEEKDKRDLTEFGELERSFNKMTSDLDGIEMFRNDFINNFSHEFKTPIVSIRGFARQLRTGDLTDEQIAKYAKMFEQPEDISPEEVESSAGFGIYGFY